MIWNPKKQCVTNDDGSLIKPFTGCSGHAGYSAGSNTYRCSSLACGFSLVGTCTPASWARKVKALVKDLSAIPGGLDGLYQVDGHYRSEHLDKKGAA
jgi:hypothetical protein